MRRFALALVLSVAVVGTAVAGFSFAGVVSPRATTVTDITVHASEFMFKLSSDTAPAGQVHFHVINEGTEVHDFAIGGQKTPTIAPGSSADITVTFTPGTYNYACTIGHHAEDGMQGAFTVTGAAATSTGVTTIVSNGTTQVVTTTQTITQPTTTATPTATVKVTEKEFKIILPSTTKRVKVNGKWKLVTIVKPVKHGLIRFIVHNAGKLPHNFVIGGKQSMVISAGKTGTLDATLTKGKHVYICSITGHAALGMKGVLTAT